MPSLRSPALLAAAALALGCGAPPAAAPEAAWPAAVPVPIPIGTPGIAFDDLQFSPTHGVLAPAGRAGVLALIDPTTHRVATIGGFTAADKYEGHHDTGITSADEGADLLFVVDQSTKKLHAVDPHKGTIVASAPLAEGPDYVRWIEPTHEVWVTEPHGEQVEIFSLDTTAGPKLKQVGVVKVPQGPESLVVDVHRGRAYANSWKNQTFAIDLRSRAVVETWQTACKKSRGLAFEGTSILFVGCGEGGAVAIDVTSGAQLGAAPSGEGVDIIAYSPSRRHLYVPAAKAQTMMVMAVGHHGTLTPLGTVPTAPKAHCVTTDDQGSVFVCDPDHGQILAIRDPFVPSL
jgi:hypothetical protein